MTKKSAGNSQEEAEGCVTQEEQGEFSERAGVSEGGGRGEEEQRKGGWRWIGRDQEREKKNEN